MWLFLDNSGSSAHALLNRYILWKIMNVFVIICDNERKQYRRKCFRENVNKGKDNLFFALIVKDAGLVKFDNDVIFNAFLSLVEFLLELLRWQGETWLSVFTTNNIRKWKLHDLHQKLLWKFCNFWCCGFCPRRIMLEYMYFCWMDHCSVEICKVMHKIF